MTALLVFFYRGNDVKGGGRGRQLTSQGPIGRRRGPDFNLPMSSIRGKKEGKSFREKE